MADVFNRITPQYIQSVHTPDFNPADWAINPDVSAAVGQPVRYWFLTGATNAEGAEIVDIVDAATQASIDAAIADGRNVADQTGQKNAYVEQRVLEGMALVLLDEINILRAEHALADRTAAQARTAVNAKIDSLPAP